MTEPTISQPGLKKKVKSFKDQADTIFGLVYILAVIVCSIPTWIDVLAAPDMRIGVAFMKFTALFTVLARPFTLMISQGNAPNELLGIAFPDSNGWISLLQMKSPEITDFNTMFQAYIPVPDFLFLVPFVFLAIALVYLGYKTSPEKNVIGEGIKFALNHYLGSLAGFVVFWGFVGMFNGLWDFGFVISGLFRTWGSYWVDLLIWIGVSIFLVAVGNFAAGKHLPAEKEAADFLVSSLQQPTPRAFPVQSRYIAPFATAATATNTPATSASATAAAATMPTITAAIQRKYCEYCGSKIEPEGKYCPGCGVSLEIAPAPASGLAASPPRMEVIIPAPRRPVPRHAMIEEANPEAAITTGTPASLPAAAPATPTLDAPATPTPKATIQKKMSQKEIEELERAMLKVDEYSSRFALLMMGVGVIAGFLGLLGGNVAALAYALFSLPMGAFLIFKDREVFTKLVFERNYTSRGIDMILWGILGSMCSGAGLAVLAKGIMMLVLSQNMPKQYPALSNQQWRARVFQASTTIAGTWTLLVTVANLSKFFEANPLAIMIGTISALVGFAAYMLYTRFVRPEIVQGRINDMDAPLIIAGALSGIASGAGIMLLLQGILIAVQKDERKKPEELVEAQESEQEPPMNNANVSGNDVSRLAEP